jgi:hypothetical protein
MVLERALLRLLRRKALGNPEDLMRFCGSKFLSNYAPSLMVGRAKRSGSVHLFSHYVA